MTFVLPSASSLSKSFRASGLVAAACALLVFATVAPAFAQTPTMLVLRDMPSHAKKGETFKPLPPIVKEDIAEIKIGRKTAEITGFDPLLKGPHVLQLMVLLDSMQMIGGNGQFESMEKFFNSMPSNVEIAIGYMLQGKVKLAQPFTTDRTVLAKSLVRKTREEAANPHNDNGNPYACLRDLASHWPGGDPAKLRAVLMFTDGIIRNNSIPSNGDMLNQDVDSASQQLQRAGIVPYPFFYLDFPSVDPNRSEGGQLEGQTNFSQLAAATGGEALQEGQFSPGSFDPLLDKLYSVLQSEAVVTVNAPGGPGKFSTLDIKSSKEDIKVLGPDSVTTGNVIKK